MQKKNRIFSNGEVVIICDRDNDKEIGKGIVSNVKTFIKLDWIFLEEYVNDKKFDRDIDNLRYEIYAIKSDGKQSSKHFFSSPHFISNCKRQGDYYIKKIQ